MVDFVTVKSWFTSKGVWGGIASVVPSIALFFGITVEPDWITGIQESVLALFSAIGGFLAIYGRIKATTRIGTTSTEAPSA